MGKPLKYGEHTNHVRSCVNSSPSLVPSSTFDSATLPLNTPPMATLTRLFKPKLSSLIKRSLSTTTPTFSDIHPQRHNSSNPPPTLTDDPKRSRNFQWVFLGCPGVGKGTYASRLSTLLDIPHISTGDLVRQELSSSSPLSHQLQEVVNQGKLVSDEIIFNLLSKRLEAGESKGESGFILDGFPRTIRQAEILDEATEIDLVVNLKLREDVLIEKCLGRRICSECGKRFNLASIKAKAENGYPEITMAPLLPPPQCSSKLITRADDVESVVRERLRIYKEQSEPVEDYYRKKGKLMEFDLHGGIPESWPKLLEALNVEDSGDKKSAAA